VAIPMPCRNHLIEEVFPLQPRSTTLQRSPESVLFSASLFLGELISYPRSRWLILTYAVCDGVMKKTDNLVALPINRALSPEN